MPDGKSRIQTIYEQITDPQSPFALNYGVYPKTIEEFKSDMQIPERRTKLWEDASKLYQMPDYQTFELDVLGYTDVKESLPYIQSKVFEFGIETSRQDPQRGADIMNAVLEPYRQQAQLIESFRETEQLAQTKNEELFRKRLQRRKELESIGENLTEIQKRELDLLSDSLPDDEIQRLNAIKDVTGELYSLPVIKQLGRTAADAISTGKMGAQGINLISQTIFGEDVFEEKPTLSQPFGYSVFRDLPDVYFRGAGEQSFFEDVFGGIGSQAAFLPLAILSPPLAIAGESLIEAGGIYEELRQQGMDDKTAREKAWGGFAMNVPLIWLTNKLGILNKAISSRAWKVGVSSFMEGVQEGLGQENISSFQITGQLAPVEQQLRAGGVGSIIGGGASFIYSRTQKAGYDMINQLKKEGLIDTKQSRQLTEQLDKMNPEEFTSQLRQVGEGLKFFADISAESKKINEELKNIDPSATSGEAFEEIANPVTASIMREHLVSTPEFTALQSEVATRLEPSEPELALESTFNVLRGTLSFEGLNPEIVARAQKKYNQTIQNIAFWRLHDKDFRNVQEDVSEVTQPGEEFYFEASVGKEGTIYKSAESGEFVKGREYAEVSFSDMPLEAEERVRAVIPQDKLAEYTNPDGLLNPQKILNSQDKELWEAKKLLQDYTTLDLLGPSALFEKNIIPDRLENFVIIPTNSSLANIDGPGLVSQKELTNLVNEGQTGTASPHYQFLSQLFHGNITEVLPRGKIVNGKVTILIDPNRTELSEDEYNIMLTETIDEIVRMGYYGEIRIDNKNYNLSEFRKGGQTKPQFEKTPLKPLQGTISQKSVLTTSPIDRMSPVVSKEEPGGIRKYTPAQFNEILQKAGMVDESISEFGNWVFKQIPEGVEILGVNSDFEVEPGVQIGNNRAAYLPQQKAIAINRQATNPKFYNSFVHEALHPFLLDKLKTNREFKEEMNAIYNEVKFRFSTDHSDYYNANKADLDRALENLDEFVAHGMSGTSVIHQWMKDTPLSNNTNQSILQKFLDTIKALLSRLFANPSPTFHQAMELSFNKHFDAPSQFNYKDLLSETVQEIRQTEEIESFDRLFELEDGFDNPRFIRAVGELIAKSQNRTETDYIRYVKGLTQEQFRNSLYGNPEWMKAAKLSYSRQNTDLTEGEYLEKIITQLYNHAYNLEKHKTIRLVLNVTKDTEGNEYTTPTLQELGTTYRTKDNTFKSSWRNKTNLASRIPELNEIFGTEFEMVYLDDVKMQYFDERGNQTAPPQWKSIPETDFNLKNRNATYAQHLAKLGYIFPGTWSDKKTVVAFRPAQKIGTILQAYGEIYTSQMNQAVFNELQKGEQSTITPEEAQVYTDYTPTDGEVFRLVIEDLKLGATVEDGRLNSVLFSKGIEDAVRIFKRSTEVAQLSKPYQSQFTTQKILKKLGQWDHGIEVLDNGKLGVNTVIINGVPEKGQWVQTINYKGRELTIDFHDVLINELGTETTDGIELYLEDGYGKAYTELYGTTKKGAIKSFVLNDKNQSPLYVKGSQQLVKRDGTLGSWMESNNIGLIIFSSAAKITSESYPVLNITSLDNPVKKGEYFTLPFDMINRDKEKGGVDLGAKGLTQSLTANLMAENNPYYADKGMEKVIKDMTDALIANFRKSMILLDGGNILERLKQKALTSDDVYEKSLSQLILDYSYTVSDKKLANAQNLPFASEGILRGYRLNQRLSNEQIASEIEGLMHEPFFAEAVRGIVRSELQNVIHFKAPGSWMVLRPDLGWLAQENIDAVWDYLSEQYKAKVDEEINVLRDELDTTMGILKAEKNEKIQKDLEKNIAKIKEEIQQKETDRHGNSKAAQEAIWKELEKIIDPKSGRLKRGYGYISKDAEKDFNLGFLKPSISTVVPSDGITAQIPFKAIVLPEGHMNSASMVLNSEDVQTIAGKDFDIDTGHLLKDDKQYFPGDNYQTYYNTIEESHKLHREKIINAYSKVLGRKITEAELYDEEVQKEFMQKLTRDSSDGQSIFNPLNAFSLLDKFAKEIGPVVNDRKSFTIKSQIGFSTKVFINGKAYDIIPASDGKYYLAAIRMTHDRVDMPTNTNGLFYEVDDEKLFDLMYNQSLVEDTDEFAGEPNANYAVSNALRAFKAADTFLFGRAIRLATPWNFEDRQADRHLPEDVQYIKEQKIINQLLKEGKNEELYNLFETWYRNRFSGIRKVLNARLAFAKDYILNLKTKDLSKSPVLYSVENIPLDVLPNIDISKELYKVWQREIAKEIIAEKYTSELEKVNKKRQNEINAFKSPISKSLLRAFALTEVINPQLHLLKAKAISLILPVDQRLFSVKQAEKLQFTNNIYDIANQYSYPKLFELLLQERFLIFNRIEPVVLTHKGKEIVLSKGQYNNLNIKIGDVTITGNDLYNSNTQWAQRLRAEFFSEEGIFKDSKNRFEFTRLLSFGRNIGLQGRIDAAVELIDNELGAYTQNEKEAFWDSLLGYPDVEVDGFPKAPLNFVAGIEGFSDQKTLLIIASRVKDKSGKDFLKRYTAAATKTYPGLRFSQVMEIKSAIQSGAIQEEQRVWYDRGYENEVKDNRIGFFENFLSIYSNIFDAPMDITLEEQMVEHTMLDLFTGRIVHPTRLGVTKYISRYATRQAADVNIEAIALTKYANYLRGILPYNEIYDRVNNKINEYTKKLNTDQKKLFYTRVNSILEQNPFGILVKRAKGTSVYYELPDGQKYIEDLDSIPSNLNRAEFSNKIDEMFTRLGIIDKDEIAANRAALLYRSIYDIWNIRYTANIANYLRHIRNNLPEGFQNLDLIEAELRKWETLTDRMAAMTGHYFPHVWEEGAYEENLLRQLEEEVRQQNPEVSGEELQRLVTEKRDRIYIQKYGTYVHGFQMRREGVVGGYIMDSSVPHDNHFEAFRNAVMTTLARVEWLRYEYKAAQLGRTQKQRNRMFKWYALQSADRYLHLRNIPVDQVKPEDRIEFWHNGRHIKGQVRKIENGFVYLKLNTADLIRSRQEHLDKYRRVADSIAQNTNISNETPASPDQLKVLRNLRAENWVANIPQTMVAASQEIIRGLENMLRNSDNWARYRINDMMIRQFDSSGQPQLVNGVSRLIVPDILDRAISYLDIGLVSSFLGNPAAMVRNWMEAHYRNAQEVGWVNWSFNGYYSLLDLVEKEFPDFARKIPGYSKLSSERQKGLKGIFIEGLKFAHQRVYAVDPSVYHNIFEKIVANREDINELLDDDKLKAVDAFAYKYIIEHGLLEKSQTKIALSEEELDKKVKRILAKPTQFFFGRSEGAVRRASAFMFAYKAIIVDKLTDPAEIQDVIDKGIEMTQSLYDAGYRRLGETTLKGKFGFRFTQYPAYQWEVYKLGIRQAKRLGQLKDVKSLSDLGFNIKSFFSRKLAVEDESGVIRIYKSTDSVDPQIPYLMTKQLWQDSIALMFMQGFPGFRAGNPISIAAMTSANIIAQWIANGEPPDEWDLKQWLFAVLSFRLGLGLSIPIDLVWQAASGNWEFTHFIPRLGNLGWKFLWNILSPGTQYDLSDPKERKRAMGEELYDLEQLSKLLTGMNLVPHTRQYYPYELNKVTSKGPIKRIPEIILPEGFSLPSVQSLVPVWNRTRFNR